MKPILCALVGGALLGACTKGDHSPEGAAAASSSSTGKTGPIVYSTKLPGVGAHARLGRGIRGGAGHGRPTLTSKRLGEAATDRELRKPAAADGVDCTMPEMDNAAACDGERMYFCDDARLWVISCKDEARASGLTSGSCFEANTFTNCLGCAPADDGSEVCCDSQLRQCCAEGGTCFNPRG